MEIKEIFPYPHAHFYQHGYLEQLDYVECRLRRTHLTSGFFLANTA